MSESADHHATTRPGPGARVVVGMSGGVDSSIAAFLLKEQGYEVVGLFMKNWEDDEDEYCSSRQDLIDAVSVADQIGVEIEAVNFAAEYRERVFAEFLREYSAGRTPNPDVLCNAEIKFRAFLDHAVAMGASHIATGHYARVTRVDGEPRLLRGLDPNKDQSYFLHRLSGEQLSRVLFPVGELHKPQVRAIAERLGLHNARKKDSTGICFIGERPFREFLNRYLPMKPGPIETPEGRRIGEHVGLSFYTLGQRKGIGIGGRRDGDDSPWYVAGKDLARNVLIAVQGHDHPLLMSRSLIATGMHWVAGVAPASGARLTVRSRYRQQDVAVAQWRVENDRLELTFESPQWAVTPGQSAVLYAGETCLGGGFIAGSERLSD
ncbi:MAG: tRNA 2-thiouridine(34) synthase MnmA [Burkholderiaceae bacterium]